MSAKKTLAALLSGAVLFSAFGPGTAALAVEFRPEKKPQAPGMMPPAPPLPLLALPAPAARDVSAAPEIPVAAVSAVPQQEGFAARFGAMAERLRQRMSSGGGAPPGDAKARADAMFGEGKGGSAAVVRPIHEGFLGRRWVKGVVRDPARRRLAANADTARVIDQISGQFGIAREEVLRLGRESRLDESSPRAAWLAVYDRLQAANRRHFASLDGRKYQGWSSFRELANISYEPGWRGALRRASEAHKHLVGFWFRLPYHLFDMFLFGYFRRAIAFEFFHAHEDFLALSERAELAKQWLEAALREQSRNGVSLLASLRGRTWFRQAERWIVTPAAAPLATFVARRLTLAVMSSLAMGVLGGLAPTLPLSFALTSIPLFGPAIVGIFNGLPILVAAVPFAGHVLAPVVSAALAALSRDLVLGPLLSTGILSTMLTYPAAAGEFLSRARDLHPRAPLTAREVFSALGRAAGSKRFWRANLKSFTGLALVGAEIEGIMTYAGQLDAAVDPGFHALFGRDLGIFHAIGAAVERPKGQSPIPFGGAITWGNVILDKFTGGHVSDAAMHAVLSLKSWLGYESAADGGSISAAAAVHEASTRANAKRPFDPDLWKKTPAEAEARIKQLVAGAGDIDAEIAAVKEHMGVLRARLADAEAELAALQKRSRPISPDEQAEYDRLLKELSAKRDEAYVRSKLVERRDLNNPSADGLAELRRLKALRERVDLVLPPPPDKRIGYWDELAVREAAYKALSARLDDAGGDKTVGANGKVPLDSPTRDQIVKLVGEIEDLRKGVKSEMTENEALRKALQAVNRVRNHSLRQRNSGEGMQRLHTDMSKLATVMDLALSMNEIQAAQAALKQMIDLLESKRQSISASGQGSEQNLAAAEANRAQVGQWRQDNQNVVDSDTQLQKDIVANEVKTGMVSERVPDFQRSMSALIDQINAEDKGASVDAVTEDQRRIDLLAKIQEWRRVGGNPNDPDAFSLKTFTDNLAEVQDDIGQAQDGLSRLASAPEEFAIAALFLAPGPKVAVSNPTPDAARDYLNNVRLPYWRDKLASFQKSLDTVNGMLSPDDSTPVVDEFGDSHPRSLYLWRSQSARDLNDAQTKTREILSALDATALDLNRVTGSHVPALSGLGLKDLQDAIKGYGDALRAVKFPAGDSPELFAAKMGLIAAAKLTPSAAREIIRWSKADATITAIDDAVQNTLPKAQAGLKGIVGMLNDIVADTGRDLAAVDNGDFASAAGRQALLDRKMALLRDRILPPLQAAKAMLTDTLIPYQQKSITDADPKNSDLFKLYDAKKTLITEAVKLYQKTLPWALATFGASEGDVAGGQANIAQWRQDLQKRLTGYDDASGHHKGVAEFQAEIARRKDPDNAETETLYGEVQPYSLPKKIARYLDEQAQRAREMNAQGAEINDILGRIEALSGGKYGLSSSGLPTDIGTDAGSAARVQALVDARVLQNLGDRLKAIADDAKSAGSDIAIGGSADGTVPVGPQPPIKPGDNQQIALLALEAAKRLVPSSRDNLQSAPAAFAVARYLFSQAVVEAADDGLHNQIPKAEAFLSYAAKSLGDAVADVANDEAYASSQGTSESAEAVYARKIAVFKNLDAFLLEGVQFFNLKLGWDKATFGTIDRAQTYYDSLHDIGTAARTVNANEVEAIDSMETALRKTMSDLEDKRQKVVSWLGQLNPKEQSAPARIGEDVSRIQEQTRAVLEANSSWHDMDDQVRRSGEIIQAGLTSIDDKQQELAALLAKGEVQDALAPELVRRIEALRLGRGGWAMGGAKEQAETIVVRKGEYAAFLDALLGLVTQGSQALAHQDLSTIKADLLKNPRDLAGIIPGAGVLDFGDTADGFYLVYRSNFGVPNGLETGSWVTLGNVAQMWGNNVSLSGYQFASPPSSGGENAPYGDKGVEVQVESLQGRRWVNYITADLHRFALDIPKDAAVITGAKESRLMLFDDFAMMLLGDRLYVGLAGYGDIAVSDTAQKPYYYGGNAKASLKLTEVMHLNAEQRAVFARDPRQFLQEVNLDFTGFDPTLDKNFLITANGAQMNHFRTQVGPSFDINRLLHPDGGGDAFTLDVFYDRTSGSEDINQQAIGATVVKGFSLRDDKGRTWANVDNRLTGEVGQVADTLGDRLTLTFPNKGIALSAEGQIVGDKTTRYAQVTKTLGDHATVALGYGSQYVGQNERLSLTLNNSFTLGELWQAVVDRTAQNLAGGDYLKSFNTKMDDFFGKKEAGSSRAAAELRKVFETDVGRKLVTQDIGEITKQIQDLRKAGALLDNTRMRGMVGFVSNPISEDTAERVAGGGFSAGAYTQLTLTKTQKQRIDADIPALIREGLRLQDRLLALTKDWQSAIVELAAAQWDIKLAGFEVENAPSESARREAEVRLAQAQHRLHAALLHYDSITGRDASAALPFQDLDAEDLKELLDGLSSLLNAPDRFSRILGGLDPEELRQAIGQNPFNLTDWLRWVDQMTAGVAVQLPDMLSGQVLTLGASVRLPIYDPSSDASDNAYRLQAKASQQEIAQAYRERSLQSAVEAERARTWEASATAIEGRGPAAAERLGRQIRAYRNGLSTPSDMRRAFDDWRWYARNILEAQSQASLARAQAALDAPFGDKSPRPSDAVTIASLSDALKTAKAGSHNLAEVAARAQAAEEMARVQDHRIQKFWLDLSVGTGLTAEGLGWLPSIGITGIPVTPVFGFELKPEEMRELQVEQHEAQKAYYEALGTRLEAGLAVQFYQNIVAYRSAQTRLAIGTELLSRLRVLAADGGVAAGRRLDEAVMDQEKTALALRQAKAALNNLLGRAEDAPLEISIDEKAAAAELATLLAAMDPVGTQKRILDARVTVARAVEEMADKDYSVETLKAEPVSIVVRGLGRLIGALSDKPINNPELAAAARVQVLNEERARDAYSDQRAAQVARLRLQLNSALSGSTAFAGRSDPESMLKRDVLAASAASLKAGLMALGENPEENAVGGQRMPADWGELRRRMVDAEQALSPQSPEGAPEIPALETVDYGSAGYVRYDYAKQTLGHELINKSYIESYMEIRLKDPRTSPDVLLKLAQLHNEKAARLDRARLAGAQARADALAAQFESDVHLLRWTDGQVRASGNDLRRGLDRFRMEMMKRLGAERDMIVALLGLAPDTPLETLAGLVRKDDQGAAGPRESAARLIEDIRKSQIDSIRRTLFEDGLPAGLSAEDSLIGQIRADTIAERMSYKGFTPVFAAGLFRGETVAGGFLEAPDPREIERSLESVMSDVLRKDLESTGRLRELSLRLNGLMTQVQDGAQELEARRRAVEAAEGEVRAKAALATDASGAEEMRAAQERLVAAWNEFTQSMVETKAAFITLVTELEALDPGADKTLRPFQAPPRYEPRALRPDARAGLLDFWTERLSDPAFEERQDALLARAGAAVSEEARARVRRAADVYRTALRDAEGVRVNDFTAAERLDLLTRNDVEGKRLALREELKRVMAGFGGLDPNGSAIPGELLSFFRVEVERAGQASASDRTQKRAMLGELREAFWGGAKTSPEVAAAFRRLEGLKNDLDARQQTLMEEYLSAKGDDPARFALKNIALDQYLKAQSAFDAELAQTLESEAFAKDPATTRVLDGLHDVRASLERSYDAAKYGRGMAAIDALIMLEETRLRAARWGGRSPEDIDRVAESLQRLRQTRERWLSGKTELQPVYAVLRLDGERRTWQVDDWLTAEDFARRRDAGLKEPGGENVIVERGGRFFIGTNQEVVGGVDVAEAVSEGAAKELVSNREHAELYDRMKDSDFVAVGGPERKTEGFRFENVFGPGGFSARGQLFFFEAPHPDGAPQRVLSAIEALSRSPEEFVIKLYDGEKSPARDRFPTLQSLEDSEEASHFRTLAVSPHGAVEIAAHARAEAAAQERRGWIEVKLNAGFARDVNGRLAGLYRTPEEFEAARRSFDGAENGLAEALRAQKNAQAEEAARKMDAEEARASFDEASRRWQGQRQDSAAQKGLDKVSKPYKEADEEYRAAKARTANAAKAVKDAQALLEESKTWTLYRAEDLVLTLDGAGQVVRVRARPTRGALGLDEAVAGGGPAERRWEGPLSAAVVDDEGRLLGAYASDSAVDKAAAGWSLVAYAPGEDVTVRLRDEKAPVKVRFSHYQAMVAGRPQPVLLSARYLLEKARRGQAELKASERWAIMPFNWLNIALEVPRSVFQAPVELIAGRDLRQEHYLGRTYMYRTEGGETDHHGTLRKALGWLDVLDVMPDPVSRFYDPSQFPDEVALDSPLLPGETLSMNDPRDPANGKDVHFGRIFLERQKKYANEDRDVAAARTLARFNGGVEEADLQTLRGRAGFYQDSALSLKPGLAIDSDMAAVVDRNGEAVMSASPDGLFVDKVERRVRIYLGAAGYARQAQAMAGYPERVAVSAAQAASARPALEAARGKAQAERDAKLLERDRVRREEGALWTSWHRTAERLGAQEELERRAKDLQGRQKELQSRLDWWSLYRLRLSEAGRGPLVPVGPSGPAFWAWVLALFGVAGLIAAIWYLWHSRRRGFATAFTG